MPFSEAPPQSPPISPHFPSSPPCPTYQVFHFLAFDFAFVSLPPLDGFLFVSKLSGAVHHGDSVLRCL